MNILVTGGAGFIGSNLCEALIKDKDNQIFCLDNFTDFEEVYPPEIKRSNIKKLVENSHFTLFEDDITLFDNLEKIFKDYSFDLVIHLAALAGVLPSIEDPLLYTNVNLIGTQYLLELSKRYGVNKFIFASSSSVYGENEKVPFEETDFVDHPISPYGLTKKAGELLCFNYHHLHNMSIVALRFFTAYGPRQRPDLAIHKFTKVINEGTHVPMYGDGTTHRDYVYIDDLVEGISSVIPYIERQKKPIYNVFNLGTSYTTELKYLIALIAKTLGKQAMIQKLPLPQGDVPITYANLDKAQKILGYNPKTKIEDGIPLFVKWFLQKDNN